jgi:hypothetical protein
MFPFGLRNAVQDIRHLVTQCMAPKPTDIEPVDMTDTESVDMTNTEFIGMADYVSESIMTSLWTHRRAFLAQAPAR